MPIEYLNFQFLLFLAILILILFSTLKMRQIRILKAQVDKLNRGLQEADEQAKLIIKTDLELNKTQEELDKKIAGLFTLQKISQALSTTLQEEEIFQRLKKHLLFVLEFEKCLLFAFNQSREIDCKICGGYKSEQINKFRDSIFGNKELLDLLSERQSLSTLTKDAPGLRDFIVKNLGVESFVICSLITNEGLVGILFLGNESKSLRITEGEEELIEILANQIAQAIENARLFEQTWRAQQDLEIKVQQRTFELTKAIEEIKLVSKRKTDFILAVSHELRTPLTSIKGYASLILAGALGNIPQEIKSRLEKINEHSDKLTQLIEDLLDISRIEAGRVKMNLQPLELKPLLDRIAEMFALQLKERGINFEVNMPEKAPQVLADNMQFERVLINLLSNAMKFTPRNGYIRININELNEHLEISVSDTGIGIPKENTPFIFQEFFRARNALDQNIKGSGLGLSLVKQIIEAHQGKIWFNTQENKGTVFSFTIPKAR